MDIFSLLPKIEMPQLVALQAEGMLYEAIPRLNKGSCPTLSVKATLLCMMDSSSIRQSAVLKQQCQLQLLLCASGTLSADPRMNTFKQEILLILTPYKPSIQCLCTEVVLQENIVRF